MELIKWKRNVDRRLENLVKCPMSVNILVIELLTTEKHIYCTILCLEVYVCESILVIAQGLLFTCFYSIIPVTVGLLLISVSGFVNPFGQRPKQAASGLLPFPTPAEPLSSVVLAAEWVRVMFEWVLKLICVDS